MGPLGLSLGSFRYRRWSGLECTYLSHSFLQFTLIYLLITQRGSEVVFELYKKKSAAAHSSSTDGWYLRVLWGGQPMETSTPLGTLDMIPVQDVFDCTLFPHCRVVSKGSALGSLRDPDAKVLPFTDIESWIGTGSELYNACNN